MMYADTHSDDLMEDNTSWGVSAYTLAEAVAALIGAFWGIKVSVSAFVPITTSLRPDSTPNVSGATWETHLGTSLTLSWQYVDDDPDSPDEADYVWSDGTSAISWPLSATPSDFTEADTIKVRIRYQISGLTDDRCLFRVRLTHATHGDVTAATTIKDITGPTNQTTTTDEITLTLNATGLANNNKTMWDDIRLRLDDNRTVTSTDDLGVLTVYAVECNVTYTT